VNAKLAEGVAEFGFPLHPERLDADAAIPKVLLRDLGRHPEASPIAGYGGSGSWRSWNDVAALNHPVDSFLDFVQRKKWLKVGDKFAKTSSASSYGRRESAIKLSMKEELPVLGIEAYDVGR
jgi:hypothetical protein